MPGDATRPATEAVFTIAPRFCFSITGSTCRRPRNTPFDVDAHHRVEHRFVVFRRGGDAALDAGIVVEAVDRPVGIERSLHIGLNIGRTGHVGGDEQRLAALLADDAGGAFATGRITVHHNDLGTVARKAQRRARPMPFPAPVISATLPLKSMVSSGAWFAREA